MISLPSEFTRDGCHTTVARVRQRGTLACRWQALAFGVEEAHA
jgi:hypothetical protein